MQENKTKKLRESMVTLIMLGAAWGIFEATVGYFLHLLPISIGFLVWYPVAAFFLMTAYRITEKKMATLLIAVLAAAIKLLNLMLPGRIDRVINPAVSILFEGFAIFAAIYVFERIKAAQAAGGMLLVSICMNTLWRLLFLGYLAFLVPDWIREASVLKSSESLIRFIVIDNLCSSCIVFAGMLLMKRLKTHRLKLPLFHRLTNKFAQALAAVLLLALNITLQMVL